MTIVTNLFGQECETCGKDFLTTHLSIEKGQGRYCCRACAPKGRDPIPAPLRFWDKVDKNGPVMRPELGPCWIWTAARHKHGYGLIKREGVPGRSDLAHRVAYEMSFGPIPDGQGALHHCDNPPCVRNDGAMSHLYAGTPKNNSDDKIARRRHSYGERHPYARVSAEQLAEIRALAQAKTMSGRAIALRFGLSPSHVNNIIAGRTRRLG